MSIRDLGIVRPGTTLYVPFHTFDSNDPSASVTITGLATTDIEIYKDGSTTQRASDNGYTLLDTDGIDFDGTTGIHGVSIDLADNSTAGFYAAGSQYWVVIASITVDGATINFLPVTFRIGYPSAILNTTIATLSTQTSFTLTTGPAENSALVGCPVIIHDVASAVQLGHAIITAYTGSTKTVTLLAATTYTIAATDNISLFPPSNTRWAGSTLWSSGAITAGSIASNAITSAKIATDAIGAAQLAADAIGSSEFAQAAADKVWSTATRTVSAATNITSTGGTTVPQTGDSFARLGAPAGASVSADVAAVKSDTAATLADTGTDGVVIAAGQTVATVTTLTGHTPQTGDSFARLGAPAGASVSADVAAVKSDTAAILDDTGTSGVLIATGGITTTTFAAGAIDAAAIAADVSTEIWAEVVESNNSITAQEVLSLVLAACAGVTSASGATFLDPSGTSTRIAATLNASQERTAVTVTPS